MANGLNGGGLSALRRWTTLILLGLLTVVVVADILDAFFFGDRYRIDSAFYGLIFALVTGLFGAEALALLRSRKNGG